MPPYIIIEKAVGETPLSATEAWRANHPELANAPLSYAGRLDPMASGKLLILIGEECKRQTEYHNLDKAYEFSILFGITSDTADVLGRLETVSTVPVIDIPSLQKLCDDMQGSITLPYPQFSAKTVNGKPLHMWTLEGKLDEIAIPTRTSTIYSLTVNNLETMSREVVVKTALENINSIPPVTDPRKALGEDFRRGPIREDWNKVLHNNELPETYQVAHLTCIASSGTYMRTLATVLAEQLQTIGLAYRIHRTTIGVYHQETHSWGTQY